MPDDMYQYTSTTEHIDDELYDYDINNFTNFNENISVSLNYSGVIDYKLIQKFYKNRSLENDMVHYSLIIGYSLLILFGTFGNILVVAAVIKNPAIKNVRNAFIINLAVSDLLLCLITMPLTLAEVLAQYWPFGNSWLVCKLFGTLQAISIFVSSITITAIALDRYQVRNYMFFLSFFEQY